MNIEVIPPMTRVRVGEFEGYISEIKICPDYSVMYSIERIDMEGVQGIGGIYAVQIELLEDIETIDQIGFGKK